MHRTDIETVAQFKSQQMFLSDPQRETLAPLADDDLVEVTRQHTPFGTFVMDVRPATNR